MNGRTYAGTCSMAVHGPASFDRSGKLRWVITEQTVYENEDFARPPVSRLVRTIWQRGGGIRLWLDPADKEKIAQEEPFSTTLDDVGFIPVGTPSTDAWWFDDVEAVQASLLNLDSVHGENLFQSVFPQLILPDGMLQTVMDALKVSGEAVMEMVRGLNYPIFERYRGIGQLAQRRGTSALIRCGSRARCGPACRVVCSRGWPLRVPASRLARNHA